MTGWRCRVGLVLPINNAVMEPELYAVTPTGVTLHADRLRTRDLEAMPQDARVPVKNLNQLGADVIVYACNLSTFLAGKRGNERITEDLNDVSSVPVTTASTAVIEALDELDVSTVSIVSPYTTDQNESLRTFLGSSDIEVTGMSGLGVAGTDDIIALVDETAQDTYRRVVDTDTAETDGVLITATDLASLETIPELEADLGKPVVSSNQAILWHSLRTGGIDPTVPGCGSLLS